MTGGLSFSNTSHPSQKAASPSCSPRDLRSQSLGLPCQKRIFVIQTTTSVESFTNCFCLLPVIFPMMRLCAKLPSTGSCTTSKPSLISFFTTPTFMRLSLNLDLSNIVVCGQSVFLNQLKGHLHLFFWRMLNLKWFHLV